MDRLVSGPRPSLKGRGSGTETSLEPRLWIDHIVVSNSFTSHITNVYSLKSGCFLSDHYPLCFEIAFENSLLSGLPTSSPISPSSKTTCIDWCIFTSDHIMMSHALVSVKLSSPSRELLSCSNKNCSSHNHLLDVYADHVASTLKKMCILLFSS